MTKADKLNNWTPRKIKIDSDRGFMRSRNFNRGDVHFVTLGENIGSEQNGTRPCVILSKNGQNRTSPCLIVGLITNGTMSPNLSDFQVQITGTYNYTDKLGNSQQLTGYIGLTQIITVAKERVTKNKIAYLRDEISEINDKLLNTLGLEHNRNIINSLQNRANYYEKLYKDSQKS